MAALAHNVLKMARKLRHGMGTPGPASPTVDITGDSPNNLTDAESGSAMPPRYRLRRTRIGKGLRSTSCRPRRHC